jgi:hypothetical protein
MQHPKLHENAPGMQTGDMNMKERYAAWTCSMGTALKWSKQTWKSSMGTWKCSIDMKLQHRHGHTRTWTFTIDIGR